MGARTNAGAPVIKRPFDLQEAVILLDVYLNSMIENGESVTKAAEIASVRLRTLAKNNGLTISDSYRSAGGLVNRIRSLAGLYEGKESKSVPGTAMFAEAVSLYKNNRNRYEEILNTEKSAVSKNSEKKVTEKRRKKAMAEKSNTAEQDFFQWLPNTVAPSVLRDIQKSYAQINVLLIKSKALPQTLTSITSTDDAEFALRRTKKTFANKRLRNTAVQLLAAYIVYLREKAAHQEEPEDAPATDDIQSGWIKYDFENSQNFAYTVPVHCSIGGEPIEAKNWARILVGITERELAQNNPAMDWLHKESLIAAKKDRPYLLEERLDGLHCAQLSNGNWVCVNYSIPRLMEMIQALCLRCGYTKEQIVLYGAPKYSSTGAKTEDAKSSSVKRKNERKDEKKNETSSTSGSGVPIEKSEAFLQSAGLLGATAKEIIKAVQPDAAVSSTAAALEASMNVIAMPNNRYVHVDSFVDLDEAEEAMGQILRTHFAQFGGYSNNQLLFGAASQELSMFLNDNDCENIDSVYAIARFFFEKKAVAGEAYKFSTPHIFEKEPDYPMTLRGLMIHLARSNGGMLHASDAKDFLQKTMLTYAGLRTLLQIGSSNTFLMYDSERYLLSESLGIDDAWCMQMHDRLDDLFRKANVAYVIPRDINTTWLNTLPLLPRGLDWTRLLLQEVLDKYPAIGFKSISPDLNQTHDTLAAAFVPIDSPLQSFPDVVTLFMEEHHTLPMRMPGEDLRLELRDAGMLENGEMIYSLPKALNDYRFAWSNENKTVYVRGNK
jgi:hypothetical protein